MSRCDLLPNINTYTYIIYDIPTGHDHGGQYQRDESTGIHHLVPPAPIGVMHARLVYDLYVAPFVFLSNNAHNSGPLMLYFLFFFLFFRRGPPQLTSPTHFLYPAGIFLLQNVVRVRQRSDTSTCMTSCCACTGPAVCHRKLCTRFPSMPTCTLNEVD